MVVYEDEDILVVAKPPGLPVHATHDLKRRNLDDIVKTRFGNHVILLHRLDRDTSGLVLFSKNVACTEAFTQLFRTRQIEKTYLALIPSAHDTTNHWQTRSYLKSTKHGVKTVRCGGDLAVTKFTVKEKARQVTLVQAQPLTGRMHQIRVHLAEAQLPILGDHLYAPSEIRGWAQRLMLHAWRLSFLHPRTAMRVEVECPPPPDLTATARKFQLTFDT